MFAGQKLILNRYRPMHEAGVGGFGTVQVAWDTRIQRKVAIKCLQLPEEVVQPGQLPSPADDSALARPMAGSVGLADDEWSATLVESQMASAPPAAGSKPEEPQASSDAEILPWDDDGDVFGDPLGNVEELGAAPEDPAFLDAIDDARGMGLPPEDRWLAAVPGLDEARTAAMLQDSNIVAVYDFEVQDRTAYLIMEYVEGFTLAELLRDHGDRLTLDMAAAVFSDVSHALEVAHASQVLHLDIKPANILVNRRGQVKVTDFGLATLTDAQGTGVAGGGTIGYMPLEQMRQEALDARCDEWALASVTYEMLAGENPFLAPDLERAEAAIEDAELVLPSLCWEELDEGVDDVLFCALDPDKEERYDTVTEFAEELEEYLGDSKRGHRQLAELVNIAENGEEPDPAEPEPRVPLAERLGPKQSAVASRVLGCAGSALLTFVSLANVPQASGWDNPLFWGVLALVALAAALKPHLGCVLSLAALAAALLVNQAYVLGALLVLVAGVWWLFVGRLGNAPANVALAVPLLGVFGCAPFASVAAGYYLTVGRAAATAAFGTFLAVVLAGFGSADLAGWWLLSHWQFAGIDVQATVLDMVMRPETWAVAASWVLAATLFSLCCSRGKRWLAVIGALLSCAALLAGVFGEWALAGSGAWMPEPAHLAAAIAASVVAVVAVCVLIPEREYWVRPGEDSATDA